MGLGLHGGGVGAAAFFARLGSRVIVTDLKTRKELAPSIAKLKRFKNITYHLGGHRATDFRTADYVIKNPGVRDDSPFLKIARRSGVKITSDTEVFFQMCPAPIIGVTGTRGKSTTAYLIWRFLERGLRRRIFLGGNIRKSILEFLPRLKSKDLVVLELSSFQLHDLHRIRQSPPYAVMTNILRDHLNWHKNLRDYIKAKSAVFQYQTPNQYLFINPDDPMLKKLAAKARAHVIRPRLERKLALLVDRNLGAHYRSSVALAVSVARYFRIPFGAIVKILKGFTGLSSRQELIRTLKGVRFINDTTATSPDATIAAVKRFRPMAKGNLILIAGGQDKNLDFRRMIQEIYRTVDILILLPGTATKKMESRIMNYESRRLQIFHAGTMREAVAIAFRNTRPGNVVLLSPGAASFGLFQNEFDRGEKFAKAVTALKP